MRWSALVRLCVLAVLVVHTSEGRVSAKCGGQPPIRAVSPSGVFELTIDPETRLDPVNRFDLRRDGVSIESGKITINGHHNTGFIDDTGGFIVLLDKYDGVTVYNEKGQQLHHFTPAELLSRREMMSRPGSWTCHTEGEWTKDSLTFGADGTVLLLTHLGRRVIVDLPSARIVSAESDVVQMAFVGGASLLLLACAFGLGWVIKRKRPAGSAVNASEAIMEK